MPLNIDFQQILLHMLNFTILFGALYFLLYKPVCKFMLKRDDYYNDLDKKTTSAIADAEKTKSDYDDKLKQLNLQESHIKSDALNKAKKDSDQILADAQKEAADIVAKAKVRANKEKDTIIRSANKEIREIAEEAAQKLVIDGEDAYDSFLNAYNAENGENK